MSIRTTTQDSQGKDKTQTNTVEPERQKLEELMSLTLTLRSVLAAIEDRVASDARARAEVRAKRDAAREDLAAALESAASMMAGDLGSLENMALWLHKSMGNEGAALTKEIKAASKNNPFVKQIAKGPPKKALCFKAPPPPPAFSAAAEVRDAAHACNESETVLRPIEEAFMLNCSEVKALAMLLRDGANSAGGQGVINLAPSIAVPHEVEAEAEADAVPEVQQGGRGKKSKSGEVEAVGGAPPSAEGSAEDCTIPEGSAEGSAAALVCGAPPSAEGVVVERQDEAEAEAARGPFDFTWLACINLTSEKANEQNEATDQSGEGQPPKANVFGWAFGDGDDEAPTATSGDDGSAEAPDSSSSLFRLTASAGDAAADDEASKSKDGSTAASSNVAANTAKEDNEEEEETAPDGSGERPPPKKAGFFKKRFGRGGKKEPAAKSGDDASAKSGDHASAEAQAKSADDVSADARAKSGDEKSGDDASAKSGGDASADVQAKSADNATTEAQAQSGDDASAEAQQELDSADVLVKVADAEASQNKRSGNKCCGGRGKKSKSDDDEAKNVAPTTEENDDSLGRTTEGMDTAAEEKEEVEEQEQPRDTRQPPEKQWTTGTLIAKAVTTPALYMPCHDGFEVLAVLASSGKRGGEREAK